jgi:hypothetical protein
MVIRGNGRAGTQVEFSTQYRTGRDTSEDHRPALSIRQGSPDLRSLTQGWTLDNPDSSQAVATQPTLEVPDLFSSVPLLQPT